jgi:WD40 repeat protein
MLGFDFLRMQAFTSLNPLHCKYDVNDEWCDGEASDTDKAVSVVATAIECGVMMTLTPAVDVTSDDGWVILVPEALELVLPWDREEDQALADIMQRHTQSPLPEDAGGTSGVKGGDEGGGEKGEKGEGGGGAARREVEWKKVAADWLQPRPDASLPAPRSDLELKERWHHIQSSAGVILEDEKIYECPAWLPLPSPTAAIADLVWDLQIASADAGTNVPKGAMNSRDDLLLSFSLRTDVLPGDVLALVLPGVLHGPSYLGKTLSDRSGASWVVYSNMASAPSHPDFPRCGFTPLSLCVPEGAAAGKDSAVLLVQTELSFRKGTAMKMNLSQLFGCGLAEAGLRLLPAGPLGAGKSGPVKACVQRLLSMRLGLALSPTRLLQGGDEVSFSLGALASLPDNQGVLRVPNFPDAVQDSLEILDLAETSMVSGGRGGKRWSSARIMVEEEASAGKPSGVGAGAKGARGGGGEGGGLDANVLIQCKTTVPIPPSAVILLTLSRLNGTANLPAVLLLHQGPGIAEVKGRARDADEEDEAVVTWPLVPGRIQGKAWWSSAQLLQKIARHQGFVNSLTVLPGADPVSPARIFTADARGVVRAWTVLADKEGLVSLVPGKSLDLVTMESADADKETGNTKGGKKPLPALKNAPGVGTGDKENVDTQNLMRKALAKLAPHTNEQHSRHSVVCLRAHDAGESSRIAALSVDSLIRVLDATTLKVLFSLSGALCRGPNACMKCSFSPDGRLVASGSEDGRLVMWQLPPPGGLASLSQLQAATYANTSGPQTCTVIQPRYQGKGECTGVIWSPTRRDMAVCCIGSPAPLLILTYNPALEALSLEKACDLVSDALDGRWSHLADHMKGSWEEGVTWDTLRRIIQLVLQDVGATVNEELESALRLVFEALSGTVAGRAGVFWGGGGAVQGRQAGLGSPVRGSKGARGRGGEGGDVVSMKTFVKGLSPKQWAILTTDALESDNRTDQTKKRVAAAKKSEKMGAALSAMFD